MILKVLQLKLNLNMSNLFEAGKNLVRNTWKLWTEDDEDELAKLEYKFDAKHTQDHHLIPEGMPMNWRIDYELLRVPINSPICTIISCEDPTCSNRLASLESLMFVCSNE